LLFTITMSLSLSLPLPLYRPPDLPLYRLPALPSDQIPDARLDVAGLIHGHVSPPQRAEIGSEGQARETEMTSDVTTLSTSTDPPGPRRKRSKPSPVQDRTTPSAGQRGTLSPRSSRFGMPLAASLGQFAVKEGELEL